MEKTTSEQPPADMSDEANARQLELACAQGDAFWRAIEAMKQQTGGHFDFTHAGQYIVGYAVEDAEGLYEFKRTNQLEWHDPGRVNAHIEIVVCDAADLRFVPGLTVTLTVMDERGATVATHEQPYLWHPWLYHYGRNWELPGDGTYSFRVLIDPPRYARHDRINGGRLTEAVTVGFEHVPIKTGQKHS